jgi:hypothetical protein
MCIGTEREREEKERERGRGEGYIYLIYIYNRGEYVRYVLIRPKFRYTLTHTIHTDI